MENIITPEMVNHEAYKFFLIPLFWMIFLAFVPFLYQNLPLVITIIMMIFPGTFLFSWVCYLYHESWHKYVPIIPNRILFVFYGWLLAHDPQVYNISHGTHHASTHTLNDIEFHPLGYIKNNKLRRLYYFTEIVLGMIFIYFVTLFVIMKHPRFSWQSFIISLIASTILYGSLFAFSYFILEVNVINIIISWLLLFIIAGSIQHNSQLIEHGNIIVDKSMPSNERNLLSRNLKPSGLLEKIFLFITHGDSKEHVLHHTQVILYTRPFLDKIPMPPKSIYITFRDYKKIIWEMITR